jgi:hypothetical protein
VAFYKFCDFILESDLTLDIEPVEKQQAQYAFQVLSEVEFEATTSNWVHDWYLPNGEPWLSITKEEAGYLLRFFNLANFLVCANGREIRCYPLPATPVETIRHLLLNQVMPLVLGQQGQLILHASTVLAPEGALAFVGQTGWGKSSLAASFVNRRLPLVTDDCLLLKYNVGEEERGLLGIPSYPGLRLWSDSIEAIFAQEIRLDNVAHYTQKKRLILDHTQLQFCSDPVPLNRIYLLAAPAEREMAENITIDPLTPREAFMKLMPYIFRLDITARTLLKQEFEHLGDIVTLPIFYQLTFPQDLSLLPLVQEAILTHCCNNSCPKPSPSLPPS